MLISDWSSDVGSSDPEAHAALGVRPQLLELALAAPAGVDLRLDDIERTGELAGGGDRFLDAHRGDPRRNRDSEFRAQFLGLIFVDAHGRRESLSLGNSLRS